MKPWIRVIGDDEARGSLKAHFDAAVKRSGKVFNIIRIMSLRPRQIAPSMGFYQTLMFDESGLSRAEREMVAVVVSQANECFY
ncbi:MAG: carboxymuconolactone decarboxylase family protein [Planctomycetes bacterium]|nr:carboxymuconolactone decarboxylase family protein [Planctomycetota bacterium]